MAEKKFLSWLGFKNEAVADNPNPENSGPHETRISTGRGNASTSTSSVTTSSSSPKNTLERIRELEAEVADLKSRRDITSLSPEEFEILATETATTLIKTAQAREARAIAAAERALMEAERSAKNLTESAEVKARSVLQTAEGRGRKYIEAAEQEAQAAIEKATLAARELLEAKQREASSITSAAKRESERVMAEATADIANFKLWLGDAIAESERLQKLQTQALAAAEEGIKHSRAKLTSAFERLASLGKAVEEALDENHRPKNVTFDSQTSANSTRVATEKHKDEMGEKGISKSPASTVTKKRAVKKNVSTTRKSVGRPPKRK
jgi:hypothetical protein